MTNFIETYLVEILVGITLLVLPAIFRSIFGNNRDKFLMYDVVSDAHTILTFHPGAKALLSNSPDEDKPQLRITFQGKIVDSSFYSRTLRITNEGQADITPEDFKKSLKLIVREKTEIIGVQNYQKPDFEIVTNKNEISVRPLTDWKKGRAIQFKLFVTGDYSAPSLATEIPDGFSIQSKPIKTFVIRSVFSLLLAFIGMIAVLYLLGLSLELFHYATSVPNSTWRVIEVIVIVPLIILNARHYLQKNQGNIKK